MNRKNSINQPNVVSKFKTMVKTIHWNLAEIQNAYILLEYKQHLH